MILIRQKYEISHLFKNIRSCPLIRICAELISGHKITKIPIKLPVLQEASQGFKSEALFVQSS